MLGQMAWEAGGGPDSCPPCSRWARKAGHRSQTLSTSSQRSLWVHRWRHRKKGRHVGAQPRKGSPSHSKATNSPALPGEQEKVTDGDSACGSSATKSACETRMEVTGVF